MSAEADSRRTAPAVGRLPLPPLAPPRPTVPPCPAVPPPPPITPSVTAHSGVGSAADGGGIAGPPTVRLRPVPVEDDPRRAPHGMRPGVRTACAAACLVLGVGLLGGAVTGSLFGDERSPAVVRFDHARELWHTLPVDTLFHRTLTGKATGPGGADRTWIRVGVAPDSGCENAFDPLLAKVLTPVGCARLLRATYADETSTSVTTVGIVFTRAAPRAMKDLHRRFADEDLAARHDMIPRTYAVRGTVAADFSDAQSASWSIRVLTDVPAVVYTVTGFADGRPVSDPQPAAQAVRTGQTTAAAQAGLGNDAAGIADLTQRLLREKAAGEEKGNAQ